MRLLEVAYDSGITHFDTARAYGYGEAETAVGEFLSRRRDSVTVTTKIGIVPPRRSRGLQAAKAVARVALSRAPAARSRLRGRAQSMSQTGRFDPVEARASLETSLRELGTDAVDVLLLHECRPPDLDTEGLPGFLEDVVREGKVRYYGIGTDVESTGIIARERPELARVAQLANNALDRTLERLPALAGRAVITHSAVRPVLGPLADLMRDDARRARWSDELGVDCGRREVLGRLLLAEALDSNRNGVVLFASASEERIRSNVELVDRPELSADQLGAFASLVREALPPQSL